MTATNGTPPRPDRLGFAVKVLGKPDLPSNDARRWKSNPHLRISIEYLSAIFKYLDKNDIRMYRMSSDVAPYATHPDLPQFHGQIAECANDLAELGRTARKLDLRLSFHPSQYILLNSRDEVVVRKSINDLIAQAEILDAMGLGPEAVLVIHAGASYGDMTEGRRRWAVTYRGLPEPVRRRLVLENDDIRFGAADVLAMHQETGVPLIFDHHHHWCHNPGALEVRPTLASFLATWPAGVRPKIHFSSPRTEFRTVTRKSRSTGKPETVVLPPIWTGHADFIHPFEFISFLRATAGLSYDVMLEAKAKDVALKRLRRDLGDYAPDTLSKFGFSPSASSPDEAEELAIAAGSLGDVSE